MTEVEALNFDHLPLERPKISLTKQQNDTILKCLPPLQYIIHYMFWSKARYNGREGYIFLTVLTGNRITIFQKKNFRPKSSKIDIEVDVSTEKNNEDSNSKQDYDFDIEHFKNLSISLLELNRIAYDSKNKTALLNAPNEEYCKDKDKKTITNIQYLKDDKEYNLTFLQCIYRNYCINFSVLRGKNSLKINCSEDYFPTLKIPLSPSQCFQFLYYAKCVDYGTDYIHQVVQYVHSLVMLGMPIVDVSKLPLISQKDQDMLKPIFEALSSQKFVCGICCTQSHPKLMDSIQCVFNKSSNINLLHLENCNMTDGIECLNSYINKKKGSNISYWNLRGNKFTDIEYFIHILKKTKTDNLLFLDLSYCDLKEKFIIDLYKALAKFPSLQQLYMANSMNTEAIIEGFDNLLTQYESSGSINLHTIDLSEIKNVHKYLSVLNKHNVPLRSLKIEGVNLGSDETRILKEFIGNSSTLRSLDLTKVDCKSEDLVDIITALNDNYKLKHFDLFMDSLKLNSGNWSPIFKAFLSGNDLETKWNSLSLNSNHMQIFDLKNLIPLFSMMNIRSLSMNDNFNGEMEGIDKQLIEVVEQCRGLKKLHIAGGEKNKLGDKIVKLLDPIKETGITEIDFSNNDAGEQIYTELQKLIEHRNKSKSNDSIKPLSSISIDGNGLKSLGPLENVVKAIKNSPVTKFDFPERDCQTILDTCEENKKDLRNRISKTKIGIIQAVNINRAKEKMMPDLPFKATKEMKSLILQMTKKMRQKISNKDAKHSLFGKELGLPLPFQDQGSDVKNKIESDDKLSEMCKTYHSNLIDKYVEETPEVETDYVFKLDSDQDYFSTEVEEENSENPKIEEEEEMPDSTRKVKFNLEDEKLKDDEENKDEDENKENKDDTEDKDKDKDNEKIDEKKEEEDKKDDEEDKKDKKKKNKKKNEEEEENDDELDKKKKKRNRNRKRKNDEEEDDSEDEKEKKRKNKKKDRKIKDDDSEDDNSEESNKKHKKKSKQKRRNKDDDSEDDDSEESNRKHKRKSRQKRRTDDDSSDDDESSNRRNRRNRRKPSRGKDSDDNSDDDDEDEGRNRRNRRRSSSRSKNEDDDSEESNNRRNIRNRRKPSRSKDSDDNSDEDERRNIRNRRKPSRGKDSDDDDSEESSIRNRRKSSSRSKNGDDDSEESNTRNRRKSSSRSKNGDDDSEGRNRHRSRKSSDRRNDDSEMNEDDDEEGLSSSKRRSNRQKEDSSTNKPSHRQRDQQLDQEDDERPLSATGRNKSDKNSDDDSESDPLKMDDDTANDPQEKKADDDMDNYMLGTSQRLGTFSISLGKSQKQPGRRRLPPPSLSTSQKSQKSNT